MRELELRTKIRFVFVDTSFMVYFDCKKSTYSAKILILLNLDVRTDPDDPLDALLASNVYGLQHCVCADHRGQ